jgi:hypothetical protein
MKEEYIINIGFRETKAQFIDQDLILYYSDKYKKYLLYQKSTNRIGFNKDFSLGTFANFKKEYKFPLIKCSLVEFRKLINKH